MNSFLLCFIPLFVAVDAPGVLPMFLGLIEGIDKKTVRKIIIQSVFTSIIVAVLFIFFGRKVLELLGISVFDFMIAGGALLFIISISDILSIEKKQRQIDTDSLGAVPIGIPLIIGPAVMTTSLLLVNEYGAVITISALAVNVFIAGIIFWFSDNIFQFIGKSGTRVLSKLASMLLASIGIMIIRKGIMSIILNN